MTITRKRRKKGKTKYINKSWKKLGGVGELGIFHTRSMKVESAWVGRVKSG